jgi:glutamate:GABA antiporter
MDDPPRDVPISVLRSAVLGVLLYAVPVFSIILVLPPEAITGIGGFIDAVTTTFTGVYGDAAQTLLVVMTLCFIGTLVTSGAVWMIGSDRIQAVSAYDGGLPGFFGVFNRRFGTPVRVNVLSGLVSTTFMVVAIGAFDSGSDATFEVVLTIAVSTTLMSYLWIFPAAVKLRFSHRLVPRPYRVPFGDWGIRIAGALITSWVALGSWVAVFPGTLESLFGLGYDFKDEWGVSRAQFETLTLGTLAVILAIALIGYALGRPVRERPLDLPLAGPPAPAESSR